VHQSFADLGLPSELFPALQARGITSAFPIQTAAIPPALAGRDIAAHAPTGSGKTLAFGLPLVVGLERAERRRPLALVLTPTRELAAQIHRDLEPLARIRHRRVLAIYGGTNIQAQRRALDKGIDAVVACPGRLLDLVERRAIDLRDVNFVVIDEADRMADMGFLPSVRRILDATATNRQTLLFSATLDGEVGALVRSYQHDPVSIVIDHEDGHISAAEHAFHVVERSQRGAHLVRLLDTPSRTIVFCRTRHGVDRLTKLLTQSGISAVALHGGHAQPRRDRALADLTRSRAHVLVATDVAARGIHVDGIDQVVHFDLAEDPKTYLHRSGRTARAGASGLVVSLVGTDQAREVAVLRRALKLDGGTVDAGPTRPTRPAKRRTPRGRRPAQGRAAQRATT
jgi:superfamily II DNA/RNA helicase